MTVADMNLARLALAPQLDNDRGTAEAVRIDGPDPIIVDGDEDDNLLGITSLYNGGYVVHWLADSDGDGEPEGFALQRYGADGAKQGGVVTLQGLSDQLLANVDNVEAFDVAALDDGGYALSYSLELEEFAYFANLTATTQAPVQSLFIAGRPTQIAVESAPANATFTLLGTGNNGQTVSIPLTVTDGVINFTQAIFDQLGVDDRMSLVVGLQAGQGVGLFVQVEEDQTYAPGTALHNVARSGTAPQPAGATSVSVTLATSDGRAEAFHLDPPSFVSGQTPQYFLLVAPVGGAQMLPVDSIAGATVTPGGFLQVPVTLDASNNVAVPQSVLQLLGEHDAQIMLVATGVVPGSSYSGTVTVRDATPQAEGVFVQTFDASGHATSDGHLRVDSAGTPIAGDDGSALGVTALDGGGLAVRWVVDADHDGAPDGLAIQRFDAAGNKVGGVVSLSGIADSLVHSNNTVGFDLVALDNGHYALSYGLALETFGRFVPISGSGTGSNPISVPIVGRPSAILVETAPAGASFSLFGTGPGGTVTIPLTVVDGRIEITQAILDQLTIDDRMTLRVTGVPAGQSAGVVVQVAEDVGYANSPLHDVARSFTLPTGGTSITASFALQTGRAEGFHLDSVTFAAGAAQNHFLLVNPVQGGGALVGSVPGATLQPNGQIQIPVTIDGAGNVAVPPALLAALGDHDATITLILTGLQPGSTISGTISTRDGTPLPEGVFVQLFGADGVALGQPAARIDAPGSAVSQDDHAIGITPLDGGGFVARWTTDSDGDGETDGLSVQRFDAAGNKVGGVVAIDAASVIHAHGGEVENFDFAALSDGSYALTYSSEPFSDGYQVTLDGAAAGQQQIIPITGRPTDFYVNGNAPGTTYALMGLGNDGQTVTVPLTAVDGRIHIDPAILDQFGIDNRFTLFVTPSTTGSVSVLVYRAADVVIDPSVAAHDVVRTGAVSAVTAGPFAGTGAGVFFVPTGRAEAFSIGNAVYASGVTPKYNLQITTGMNSLAIDLTGIAGAIRLQNGQIIVPVTPDHDGRVAVPQSILDQLGDYDASIQLVILGLQLGTGITGTVSVRDAIPVPEGVFVHTFDAAGHPTGGDLTVTGDVNANELHGAQGDDSISGGDGNDLIDGGAGNDRIDGGTGADQMIGGLGNDVFKADRQDDLVFEHAGEGTDTVIASGNYYLYANIENLTLATGAGDIFGVGNDLGNEIAGNEGANLILGGGGDDVAHGNAGNDVLYGQDGNDFLSGDAGVDYLIGGDGQDVLRGGNDEDGLYGEGGNDILWGGTDFKTDIFVGGDGNDVIHGDSGQGDYDLMDGGAGDDDYYVDTGADLTFEAVGGGNDTVYADVGAGQGVYLYANVENLVLLGSSFFGVGNELDNRLTGNASANWLLGGAGADTIDGKGGADVLYGEAGADTFVFKPGSGADYVGDFTPGSDRIDLSAYGFTSFAQVQSGMTENAGTTAINFGNGNYVVLNGVAMATLHEGDFVYAVAQSAQLPEQRAADDGHGRGLLHLLDAPQTVFALGDAIL